MDADGRSYTTRLLYSLIVSTASSRDVVRSLEEFLGLYVAGAATTATGTGEVTAGYIEQTEPEIFASCA